MTTRDKYTTCPSRTRWEVASAGDARFTWEYDDGRDRLLALYQKGKDKQWDAPVAHRLGRWRSTRRTRSGCPTSPSRCTAARAGTQHDRAAAPSCASTSRLAVLASSCTASRARWSARRGSSSRCPTWTRSSTRPPRPWTRRGTSRSFARFLQEKIGLVYPINEHLKALLDDTLRDSRWDMPYLGMQVLIEGLALAAFGVLRDMHDQAAAQADPGLRHAGRGPARRLRPDGAAGLLLAADRRRAGRARGVRRRGLLPDARPVPRRGGLRELRPRRRSECAECGRARRR